MKKISLLSDTHSKLDERFIPHLKNSDEIWHAGDIGSLDVYDKLTKLSDVKAVYGNVDNHKIRIGLKSELFFKCEGLNIYMTHIGGYPGKYSKGIKEKIERSKRESLKVLPEFKKVDTSASEFKTYTPYKYSTYQRNFS